MRPTTHDSEETTEVYIEVLKQVNVWCIWIVFITTLQSAYPKIQFIGMNNTANAFSNYGIKDLSFERKIESWVSVTNFHR